jgi:hypothetical protein
MGVERRDRGASLQEDAMRNNAQRNVPDGHEAYRDDAVYTAPEMRPGHGENLSAEGEGTVGLITAATLAMPAVGGGLAGEALRNPDGVEFPRMRWIAVSARLPGAARPRFGPMRQAWAAVLSRLPSRGHHVQPQAHVLDAHRS